MMTWGKMESDTKYTDQARAEFLLEKGRAADFLNVSDLRWILNRAQEIKNDLTLLRLGRDRY